MNKSLLDTDIFSDITKGVNPTVIGHATAYRKITGNTAHFQRVQQLGYPLILVNWRV